MLPRLLVIDDLFGRVVCDGRNVDREGLCAQFLWKDATNDAASLASLQKILNPTAEVVFCRGQTPVDSPANAVVENDLLGTLEKVREGWTNALAMRQPAWAMVLLDLCFYTGRVTEDSHRCTPGMPEGRLGDDDPTTYFGLTLLDAIKREFDKLPVVILSSKPREEVSLKFTDRLAAGFIDRSDPNAPELLEKALWKDGLLQDSDGESLGYSPRLLEALREARLAAGHLQNVLVRGERGTGKELLARYLHRVAPLKGPLITVNPSVLTSGMFASELFGVAGGAATGVNKKAGLIELADGGDLFLDEIAHMPSDVQPAMLRVLLDRQITRVGGRTTSKVDVRFLSATNVDIEQSPTFLEDLLDRLRLGGTVWLPALRERPSDIPLLTETFVRRAESQQPNTRRREVTDEAMDLLLSYDWPGNVRELEKVVLDAVTRHADLEHLVPSHLRLGDRKDIGRPYARLTFPVAPSSQEKNGLDSLLRHTARTEIDPIEVGSWSGKLDDVLLEYARLTGRMLQAALTATRRRTPASPHGELQIHPAVKLLTGDAGLTASKAADLIKRLLAPIEHELTGDLAEAHGIALRLRPRSAGQSARNTGSRGR